MQKQLSCPKKITDRGKGNAGRLSKQASKKIYSNSGDIMEELVAVVHPYFSQNLLHLSEK